MPYAWKIAVLTAAIVVSLAPPDVALVSGRAPKVVRAPVPDLVELPPGAFQYRAIGNFTRDGKPAQAPLVTAAVTRTLAVMRHQVTADEYRRCVDAGACASVDRRDGAAAVRWQGELARRRCLCRLAVARDGSAFPAADR